MYKKYVVMFLKMDEVLVTTWLRKKNRFRKLEAAYTLFGTV